MGLFSKKLTKQRLTNQIKTQMISNENLMLSDFYKQEKVKENQLKSKIAHPPKWVFKKESYKAEKQEEINELRTVYNNVFDLETMDAASTEVEDIKNELKEKREINQPNKPADIEEISKRQDVFTLDKLLTTNISEESFDELKKDLSTYRKLKMDVRIKGSGDWDDDKKASLEKLIAGPVKESMVPILKSVFGDIPTEDGMRFLKEKHPEILSMMYYSVLLKKAENECGKLIRTDMFGLNKIVPGEYAQLYSQRQITGSLLAELLNGREKLLEEFNRFVNKSQADETKEDEDFHIENNIQTKEEIHTEKPVQVEKEVHTEKKVQVEKEVHTEKKVQAKEEIQAKENSKYLKILQKLEAGDKMNKTLIQHQYANSPVAMIWNLYDECKAYAEGRESWRTLEDDDLRKLIAKFEKNGCFNNFGQFTEIAKSKSSWLNDSNYGVRYLMNENEQLFWQHMLIAITDRLSKVYASNNLFPEGQTALSKAVASLKEDLQKDKEKRKQIDNMNAKFIEHRRNTLKKVSDDHPESFPYYEFMNSEVVKSNHFYDKHIGDKPGLFKRDDFTVFDSNNPQVLEAYVEKFKERLSDKNHDPILDDFYYYLKKHVNYRISVINKINELSKKKASSDNSKYKLVKESPTKYELEGYKLNRQTSGQGCWSVAMSAMLKSKGIELSQEELRSYRYAIDEQKENHYADSYYQNTNSVSSITDHMNLIAQLMPDQILYQKVFYTYGQTKNKLADNILAAVDHAINMHKTPLVILYKGHFRTIYGRDGNMLYMHDSMENETQFLYASDIAEQILKCENSGVYWLEDKPEEINGERTVANDGDYLLYYDKEDNLQHGNQIDEIPDEDAAVKHYNYYKYGVGGNFKQGFNTFAYLTDAKRKNAKPNA